MPKLVKCFKVPPNERRSYGMYSEGLIETRHWPESPPFLVSRMLIHRIKRVSSFWVCCTKDPADLRPSHSIAEYWCANRGRINDTDRRLIYDPAEDEAGRLVCARCEAFAVAAGEPSVDELMGRHIHIGGIRVVQQCCRDKTAGN